MRSPATSPQPLQDETGTYPALAGMVPATLGKRFAGRLVEAVVGWLVIGVAAGIGWFLGDGRLVPLLIAVYGVGAVYAVVGYLLLGFTGYLPGGQLVGLRLVKVETGGRPGWSGLLKYLLAGLVSSVTFGIGYLVIIALISKNPLNRGWHDRMTGVIVIDAKASGPVGGAGSTGQAGQPTQGGAGFAQDGQFGQGGQRGQEGQFSQAGQGGQFGQAGQGGQFGQGGQGGQFGAWPSPPGSSPSDGHFGQQPTSHRDLPGQPGQPPHDLLPQGQQIPGQQIPGQQFPSQQPPHELLPQGQQSPSHQPPQGLLPPSQQNPGQQFPSQGRTHQAPDRQYPGQSFAAPGSGLPASGNPSPPTQTSPPTPPMTTNQLAPTEVSPAVSRVSSRWRVRFDDGRVIPLQGVVLVGRNPAAHPAFPGATLVPIDDESRSVSKTHLVVGLGEEGGTWVMDLQSTNGSALKSGAEQLPLVPRSRTRVPEGSVVCFGARELLLESW